MLKYRVLGIVIGSFLVANSSLAITPDGGKDTTTDSVVPPAAVVVTPVAPATPAAKKIHSLPILDNPSVADVRKALGIGGASNKDLADLEDAGFGSFIEFRTDSDTVIPSPGLYVILEALLNLESYASILIVGHTDNVGTDDYNLDLSFRRARSVRDWLEDNGVRRGAIRIKGAGYHIPIDDNDTEEGRRRNRRVEFSRIYD